MANYYGTPAIVTDGLVFAVDAGNGQSYVSGSGNCFSLVSSDTGSLQDSNGSGMYSSDNQGTWDFDGVDDYIDCGNVTSLAGSNYASWEFWAKSSDTGGNPLSQWVNYDPDYQFYITINPSTGYMDFYINGTIAIRSQTSSGNALPITIDAWYHYCFTFDTSLGGFNTPIPFVNGIQVSTSQFNSGAALKASTVNLHIGKKTDITTYEWLGNIASVKIYNKALSTAEVLQNYNATKNRFI